MPSDWDTPENDPALDLPYYQELAEQLREDAQFLAGRYPPQRAPEAPPSSPWRGRLAGSILAAGVALVACGVWLWDFGSTQDVRQRLPDRQLAAPAESPLPADLSSRVTAESGSRPPTMPAMVFRDLSGPEQEAVLDLMEDNFLSETSLSL